MEGGGITNPLVLIGRTFFDGGFQIRRNAWRACVPEKRRRGGKDLAGGQVEKMPTAHDSELSASYND